MFVRLFPVWTLLVAALAFFLPATFHGVLPYVSLLLGFIMFAMGVSLSPADFRRVALQPGPVLAGLGLHYLIMPLAAYVIAKLLALPDDLATGMILVGSVASGTASTVMVFLSGGDVALSVTISAFSTLVGVMATPFLTRFYVSADVAVDTVGFVDRHRRGRGAAGGAGPDRQSCGASARGAARAGAADPIDPGDPADHRRRGGQCPGRHRAGRPLGVAGRGAA
ncbi:bile acid:sodium symporter family protein [Lichenihabitans sp. Uapishka_5]|nr:bile acid:sodium symporter family protein [Lichenihabitans sp. Uapishka_5]MDX7952286.1 bile acid:sodium symporter family protein [Lichenihabitans sp. Uapishka_5]